MKEVRRMILLLLIVGMSTGAQAQGWEWIKSAGGSGSPGGSGVDELGIKIINDSQGNVYIAGYVWPGAVFDTLTIQGIGEADIFLASYDSMGNFRWVEIMGGSREESQPGSATIGLEMIGNSIYISSSIEASLTTGTLFRVGDSLFSLPASTGSFIFLSKFSLGGEFKWVQYSDRKSLFHGLSSNSSDKLYILYSQLGPLGNFNIPDSGLYFYI